LTPRAFQTVILGWSAAFVVRLSSDGSALLYSTYLGASSYGPNTHGRSIAVGPGNEAFVAGRTYALSFPVTPGAFRTRHSGGSEAFLSRLDPKGTRLIASTFFGGDSGEGGLYVSQHRSSYVTLGGWTISSDLPVTANAFQSRLHGSVDAFFAILDPQLTRLIYGTYYGGSRGENDISFSQNASGRLVIMGSTDSLDLPGARGRLLNVTESFAAVFDPFQLVDARYVNTGSDAWTWLTAAAFPLVCHIDASGIVTFTGVGLLPTTMGAWQRGPPPRTRLYVGGYVGRMGPDLELWYGSYFGGSALAPFREAPTAITRTRDGWTVLGGDGASPEIATPGVFNRKQRGWSDGFVARMDLLPTGVNRYGGSSGACQGQIIMDVTRMPAAGALDFTVVCSAAPPSARGWLILSAAPDHAGTPILGAILHVSTSRVLSALPLASDTLGLGVVRLPPLPVGLGARFFAQFVWVNTANCPGAGPLSSSNALEIVVQ
jgi:hypothetical protein